LALLLVALLGWRPFAGALDAVHGAVGQGQEWEFLNLRPAFCTLEIENTYVVHLPARGHKLSFQNLSTAPVAACWAYKHPHNTRCGAKFTPTERGKCRYLLKYGSTQVRRGGAISEVEDGEFLVVDPVHNVVTVCLKEEGILS
jgi:hypothetical protein